VVPIQVIVMNQGEAHAKAFKVATSAITASGTFNFAFSVPGQASPWYPFTSSPLSSGDQVVFDGVVTFPSSYQAQEVQVFAEADSCAGDEFMPLHCRVLESEEGNNRSESVLVRFPEIIG